MLRSSEYLWDGRLSDSTLEAAYSAETLEGDFKRNRIACLVTVTAYMLGAIANYLTFGLDTPFIIILSVRCAVLVAALAAVVSTKTNASRSVVDHLVFVYFALLVLCDNVELYLTPAKALPELPGLLVIVLVYYMFYPSRLRLIIIGGLFAGITYPTTIAMVHGVNVPLFANAIISFVLANGFGIFHVRTMNKSVFFVAPRAALRCAAISDSSR